MSGRERRWNHNIHYYPLVLAAVPPGCQRALDVGCGEGMLARQLADRVPQVVGIDQDAASVAAARRQGPDSQVGFVRGDFLAHPFPPASFGLISCVAALHHMDPGAALARMSQLLAPGGTLVVVGLARSRLPDLPRDAVAVITNLGHRVTKGYWQHPSPTVWPPPHSHPEIRVLAGETLPGARYRRHLLWRYSLVWVKPGFRSCHALSAECSGLPQYPGGRPVPAARRVGLGYRTSCPGCGCAGIEPSRPAW